MKNIFYLLHTTRNHLLPADAPKKKTYFGVTNFLHRQIMWHNHKWNPRDYNRKLKKQPLGTLGKFGWRPFVVVDGFKSEEYANIFRRLFYRDYDQLPVKCDDVMDRKLGYDELDFRLRQLKYVCEEYCRIVTSRGKLENLQLRFHWDAESDEYKQSSALNMNDFPITFSHVDYIDVRKIDNDNYDQNDVEDDRNYHKLRKEKELRMKREKLERISQELGIQQDELEDVLHKSRAQSKKNLASVQSLKHLRKVKRGITINK